MCTPVTQYSSDSKPSLASLLPQGYHTLPLGLWLASWQCLGLVGLLRFAALGLGVGGLLLGAAGLRLGHGTSYTTSNLANKFSTCSTRTSLDRCGSDACTCGYGTRSICAIPNLRDRDA